MRRELVLQLKLGRLSPAYFADKYKVDILEQFARQFDSLRAEGYLARAEPDGVALTRNGLLRVDSLLPRFFKPEHTNIRYT
jgi:oxygen-independent coproporphyrinogen-3 oxidase